MHRLPTDALKTALLNIFYSTGEFFTLRELETIVEERGLFGSHSVQCFLTILIDDNLVKKEKIQTTDFFYAIPGGEIAKVEQKIARMHTRIIEARSKMRILCDEKRRLTREKNFGDQLDLFLDNISQLRKKDYEVKQELAKYADPEIIDKMTKKAEEYKEAANIWTDNIFATRRWCKEKLNMSDATLQKQFLIKDDLDYVK